MHGRETTNANAMRVKKRKPMESQSMNLDFKNFEIQKATKENQK